MSDVRSILIVGVGGQGVVLASAILSEVAMEAGLDTKQSEIHGMSQRGGVVASHVRFGQKVWSPMVPEGGAHLLLAFERAEALRAAHLTAADGRIIVNRQSIIPPLAAGKKFSYPDDPIGEIRDRGHDVLEVEAWEECRRLGNARMVSVLLLGSLAANLDFPLSLWEQVIARRVPRGTAEANLAAFARGRELATMSAAG